MIMKKRHAYNLAILLAAGSIMISACGKKTDVPADKTVPAQTESQTETSPARKNLHLKRRFRKIQKAANSICSREPLQKLKKTALHLPYWLTTEKSIRLLFLIFMM